MRGGNEVYGVESTEHGVVVIRGIHDCILDVNVEEQTMKVHLLEGLIS